MTEIHPLMVMFAVMVSGEIGGIVGIYLSIPFVVIVRVIWPLLHYRKISRICDLLTNGAHKSCPQFSLLSNGPTRDHHLVISAMHVRCTEAIGARPLVCCDRSR